MMLYLFIIIVMFDKCIPGPHHDEIVAISVIGGEALLGFILFASYRLFYLLPGSVPMQVPEDGVTQSLSRASIGCAGIGIVIDLFGKRAYSCTITTSAHLQPQDWAFVIITVPAFVFAVLTALSPKKV
jgi:hypothetical protein